MSFGKKSNNKKHKFGKNINKSTSSEEVFKNSKNLHKIDIKKIKPNPYQPRMELTNIDELKESIKSLGLLQPLTVSQDNGDFTLIYGHRRLQALKELGKESIDCVIVNQEDSNSLQLKALAENLQRENLEPLELAIVYKDIISKNSISYEEFASRINRSKAHVSQVMSLFKLDTNLQTKIKDDGYKILSVLNKLNQVQLEKQLDIYNQIKDLTRDEALKYIDEIIKQSKEPKVKNAFIFKNRASKYKIDIDIDNLSSEEKNNSIKELKELIKKIKSL
jgi:ParB family chromosome partitioning protein